MSIITQRCRFCHELCKWEEPNECLCDCPGIKCFRFIKAIADHKKLGEIDLNEHSIALTVKEAEALLKELGEIG